MHEIKLHNYVMSKFFTLMLDKTPKTKILKNILVTFYNKYSINMIQTIFNIQLNKEELKDFKNLIAKLIN